MTFFTDAVTEQPVRPLCPIPFPVLVERVLIVIYNLGLNATTQPSFIGIGLFSRQCKPSTTQNRKRLVLINFLASGNGFEGHNMALFNIGATKMLTYTFANMRTTPEQIATSLRVLKQILLGHRRPTNSEQTRSWYQ